MIASLLYAVFGAALFAVTIAALYPRAFGREAAPVMAVAAMSIAFFIPQLIVLGLIYTGLLYTAGGLTGPAGLTGLAFHAVSWMVLSAHLARVHAAVPVLDGKPVRDEDQPFTHGFTDDELRQLTPGRISWRPSLTLRIPAMLDVEVKRDILYREVGRARLRLDVYSAKEGSARRPSILYVHGGGWFTGTRRQSRYMMYELAAAGFTVFSISYRLAPRYPLPAAIEDAKAGVAWVRAHAEEYGGRSDLLFAVGGSAGGHLVSLLALSPNVARFQPGFEAADTRVDGAVIMYGPSQIVGTHDDVTDHGRSIFFERFIFRRRYRDDPDLFHAAEPIRYVHKDAPPILLVHGERDALVNIGESRRLAARLREEGAGVVHMLEVPLAHHAFEVFPSPLHQRTVRVIVRFLVSIARAPA